MPDNQIEFRAKNQRAVRIVDIRTFHTEKAAHQYVDHQLKIGRACQKEIVERGIHQVKAMELV